MWAIISSPSKNFVLCGLGFLIGISFSVTLANGENDGDARPLASDIFVEGQHFAQSDAIDPDGMMLSAIRSVEQDLDNRGKARLAFRPVSDEISAVSNADIREVRDALRANTVEPAAQPPAERMTAGDARESAETEPVDDVAVSIPQPQHQYGLHLASISNPANAQDMITALADTYRDELSEKSFYRLKSDGAGSKQFIRVVSGAYDTPLAASSVCAKLKTQGQYCAVVQLPR